MSIKHKHSDQAGHVPNLIPGQVGINLVDEKFWIRSDGKKVGVDIRKWQDYSAPATKAHEGAPLMMTPQGPVWQPHLAPSSVVDGRIEVDQVAPNNIYGVPGMMVTGLADSISVIPNRAYREDFYIASDQINIDKVVVRLGMSDNLQIKFVLATGFGEVITTANINTPVSNATNSAVLGLNLLRGWYQLIFWSQGFNEVQQFEALAYDMGWDYNVLNEPQFIDRYYGNADFTTGVDLSGIGWFQTVSTEPGARRFMSCHWTIPTPS